MFSEAESKLGKKISLRVGLRGEYASVNNEATLSPRLSAAFKTGENSQVSAAYGIFNQLPKDDFLKINQNLESQRAVHYIANYQYQKDGYLFRIEGYLKDYSKLTRFPELNDYNPDHYSSNGYGLAKGIDIFWRDQKSVRNGDYWLSVTILDAKKKYENYPRLMYPAYFSKYNAAAVYKQYIPKLETQVAMTYQFSSGRPYLDPIGKTHYTNDLNNLSLSVNYLTRLFNKFTVVYLSVSNVLGFDQVYGYHFIKSTSNGEVSYDKMPIKPPAKRFVVFGFFISLNDKF
ncbi:MAG: TonB-dependent receptor [Bacteroidales bacterium]|nr:TonB-dependent receptor [Bacteroidales bacterium]